MLTLVAVVASLTWSSFASAQPFDVNEAGWEGCKALVELARNELGEERVVATGKLDWHALQPTDGLLVLHPEVVLDGDELAAFLREGGRAAVLDDFGVGDKILQRYQIKRVPPPALPLYTLRNNPNLALAEPVSDTVAGRRIGVHPVVADVRQLVTNHPSGLMHPDLSTVLKIRASDESDVALALAGQVGKGRLFAMGDPSTVINQMLRYPGNRAFATGLVRYLVELDDEQLGRRHGKLYIVSNRFDEVGLFGAETSDLREMRERMRALRSELEKISHDGLPREWAMALAILGAAGLLLWTFQVASRPYRHPQPRFARAMPLLAQGGVAGRAAVLVAESTHRGLIALEQKDALEEELSLLLGMERRSTLAMLIEEIQKQSLLDASKMSGLKQLVAELAKIEAAVAAGTPIRVSQRQLLRAEEIAREVCVQIGERLRSPRGVA